MLRDLSALERAVVVLRYYCDLTEKDTAASLRIPVGTVKSAAVPGIDPATGGGDSMSPSESELRASLRAGEGDASTPTRCWCAPHGPAVTGAAISSRSVGR